MEPYLYLTAAFTLLILLILAGRRYKVTAIADGDTLELRKGGKKLKVRLYGIDTPEKQQTYGPEAGEYIRQLLLNKRVGLKIKGTDRYGRAIALIYHNNRCVNKLLIKKGIAWIYRQYCTKNYIKWWDSLESKARRRGNGLWAKKNPTPPWEWRKKHK